MRYFAATVLLGIGAGISPDAFAADDASVCHHFADTLRGRVDSIVHDGHDSFAQKHEKLTRLFEESVDLQWVTENVAGSYWQTASEPARQSYARAYRAYLTNYYMGGVDEDTLKSVGKISLLEFKQLTPSRFTATLQVTQTEDDPIMLGFEMAEAPTGVCRIHDFTVEGVDMLTSQNEEIQSLGAQGGLAFIVEKLNSHPH